MKRSTLVSLCKSLHPSLHPTTPRRSRERSCSYTGWNLRRDVICQSNAIEGGERGREKHPIKQVVWSESPYPVNLRPASLGPSPPSVGLTPLCLATRQRPAPKKRPILVCERFIIWGWKWSLPSFKYLSAGRIQLRYEADQIIAKLCSVATKTASRLSNNFTECLRNVMSGRAVERGAEDNNVCWRHVPILIYSPPCLHVQISGPRVKDRGAAESFDTFGHNELMRMTSGCV